MKKDFFETVVKLVLYFRKKIIRQPGNPGVPGGPGGPCGPDGPGGPENNPLQIGESLDLPSS